MGAGANSGHQTEPWLTRKRTDDAPVARLARMTVFKLLTLLVIGTCSSPWPQTDLTVNCLEPAGQTSNQVRVEPMNMAKQRTGKFQVSWARREEPTCERM